MSKAMGQPTPFQALNDLLQELVDGIGAVLDDQLVGVYLQGSFAVGDFDQHSDVDFTVVVRDEVGEEALVALQHMHGRLYERDTPWAQHLEGSYFPLDLLRDLDRRGRELWFLDNGSRLLEWSDHCNTAVVRWVLREKGIALTGPPAATLVPSISRELLCDEIAAVIEHWGGEILADPDRFNNRFYQGFIALSFCRMLQSLETGTVTSKAAGAAWAKRTLDPAWSDLIDSSWDTRPDPARSVRQPADPDKFAATLAFVRYCIDKVRDTGSDESS